MATTAPLVLSPYPGGRAWHVEGLLSRQECASLIELAERQGFAAASVRTPSRQELLPAIRNNERVVFEDPSWVELLWARLRTLPLPVIDGQAPLGLPKALRFYKYNPGQRFKMHKDGAWQEDGNTSKLTLLVYLNEEFSGGATDFKEFFHVPATGSAVLFLHDTWHEGQFVEEGVKYALRSDVLYAPPASAFELPL